MKFIIALLIMEVISCIMPEKVITSNPKPENQEAKPLFSFGLIADIQYCDCDATGTRYYRNSLEKLEEAIRSFRADSPAFIVNLGDMIDHDYVSYNRVYQVLDTAGLKIYNITGNHDYSVEPRLKKRIPPLKSEKEGYYSFTQGKFRFIILNGNEFSTYAAAGKKAAKEAGEYLLKLKNSGEENAMDWNGGMSNKQIVWLKNQLNSSVANGEKVFILCHFPVFPVNEYNLLNYKEVLSLLEGFDNIIAWFNGHNHAGNYGNYHLIHFVTMRGMVETEQTNSFALVEVYNNKIWIKGRGREKSQILAY